MRKVALLCLSCLLLATAAALAEDKPASKLDDALSTLKQQSAALGAPRIEGVTLFFGTTKINGNYEIVDAVKEKHGCVATFFAKKDDAFIRVSTNVQKEGNRAVGTKLDPAGKAYAAVSKGQTYSGDADILGAPYTVIYEPIKSDKGDVIGIYFVGIPK